MSNPEQPSGGLHATDSPQTRETDEIPVPEYDVEQYIPRSERISAARREVLKREFGLVRTYFKSRPENHWRLQRKLNQARLGTTYDVYLTRTVAYTTAMGVFGALLGLLLTALLSQTGVIATLQSPWNVRNLGGLVTFVSSNRVVFAGATVTLVSSLGFAAITWITRYYYPFIIVDGRRRNTNVMLPHAIVYMYALSFGGMNFVEVLRRMADAEETYGEVANEFDTTVRDIEVFGNDLFTALRNTRNLTPSDNLEMFLDDMLSVLDSGGNMTEFLHDESEKYMERAKREQEEFLETLATLSEVFIVAFVATPLFVIVTMMLMSFLGGNTIPILVVFVYAVLPLGMAGFLVLVAVLSEPYKQPDHDLDLGEAKASAAAGRAAEHPGYKVFRGLRRRARLAEIFSEPTREFKHNPLLSLAFSVPIAALVTYLLAETLGVPATVDAFLTAPFVTTAVWGVVPFLLVAGPLSAFHEYDNRRKRAIAERLPDMLDILASANQMGIQLVEGLDLVTRNISGHFSEELRKLRNDIRWNQDIRRALLSMADRLSVSQLTRTCKIIAEGSRSTGNLYRILDVAAEDTRHRYWLERNRRQKMNAYLTIVMVGFLVFLGVIVIIDHSFLAPFQEIETTASAGPISFNSGSMGTYHALFLHAALVQAVGTGMIAGKLSDNSILSGLKYSIGLVLLAMIVFSVI